MCMKESKSLAARVRRIGFLLVLSALAMQSIAAPGDVDLSFDPGSGVPHHDPATMQTNVPGVFIAGVLSAGFHANRVFIENGREHGQRIVAELVRSARGSYDAG